MSDKSETFELIVVQGRRKWLCSNGKVLPYVSGGAGGNEPPPNPTAPPAPAQPPTPPGAPEKTFTQDELNDIIKKRLDGARSTAQADLLKDLGITDPTEAKALIAAAKAAEEANATELDKANKRATENETKATSATAALEQHQLTTAIVEALVDGGLTVAAAKKVRAMVTVDKLDTTLIEAAIADLKKDMPSLFETSGNGGPPGHNPGGPPPGGPGKPNDPQAQAMRTLHERHPHLKKTS